MRGERSDSNGSVLESVVDAMRQASAELSQCVDTALRSDRRYGSGTFELTVRIGLRLRGVAREPIAPRPRYRASLAAVQVTGGDGAMPIARLRGPLTRAALDVTLRLTLLRLPPPP